MSNVAIPAPEKSGIHSLPATALRLRAISSRIKGSESLHRALAELAFGMPPDVALQAAAPSASYAGGAN